MADLRFYYAYQFMLGILIFQNALFNSKASSCVSHQSLPVNPAFPAKFCGHT